MSNDTGQPHVHVTLSTDILRSVALSHPGRWPSRKKGRAEVNVLSPSRKADMGAVLIEPLLSLHNPGRISMVRVFTGSDDLGLNPALWGVDRDEA